MSQLRRRAVDFRGWQSEVDYLASEAERQKRVERAIELHKRMQDEVRPLALKWRLTIVFSASLLGAFVLWQAITWVIDSVLQGAK